MIVMTVVRSAAMRKVLRDVISTLTDSIVECGDCGQALACYPLTLPGVVIVDVDAAAGDWLAGTRVLLARDGAAHVLAVSQYDDADSREQARLAGMHGYFLKDRLEALMHHLRAIDHPTGLPDTTITPS